MKINKEQLIELQRDIPKIENMEIQDKIGDEITKFCQNFNSKWYHLKVLFFSHEKKNIQTN